jgi:hypothetical protein
MADAGISSRPAWLKSGLWMDGSKAFVKFGTLQPNALI